MRTLLGLVTMVLLGCAPSGVGEPCAPQRPFGDAGNGMQSNQCIGGVGPGCFLGTEIYIETQSLQCRSRICLVYKFSESPTSSRESRAQSVYCTCRCGAPATLNVDRAALCTCPADFACVSLAAGDQWNPGVRGSYCVRSAGGG